MDKKWKNKQEQANSLFHYKARHAQHLYHKILGVVVPEK